MIKLTLADKTENQNERHYDSYILSYSPIRAGRGLRLKGDLCHHLPTNENLCSL